jgi:alginate O-acetyltransferase complex protein AlgI
MCGKRAARSRPCGDGFGAGSGRPGPPGAVNSARSCSRAKHALEALTPEQVATLPPDQAGKITQTIETLRWTTESSYFRWLHELLPEPFFQTQGFLLFAAGALLLYWVLPWVGGLVFPAASKKVWNTYRVWLLVIASFHFYAAWNASLAFLVTGTATLDYFLARGIEAAKNRRLRFALMWCSILMNLGVLCYFKYRGFFLNELHSALANLGYDPGYSSIQPWQILIPFGISFYTFEAISYAVDVYKGKIRAERSLPHFMLFILFFPHLVAGPIVRAGDFLRQAHRPKRWNWVRVQVGVQLFLLGLFKKLAIADRMAVFCDGTPGNPGPLIAPENYNSSAIWLSVLAYALRIYADFSGYSDMAVGTAHLFGFRLTQNFNMPYLAANVTEFWRRWHISLSTWLRDYLYIPLGGSRAGPVRRNLNLMVTMLLGGLWHGANWPYVIWGGLHGLMLIVHKQFAYWCEDKPRLRAALDSVAGTALRVFFTFFCVSLCWVFFRPDLDKALIILEKMFLIVREGASLPLHNRSLWYTVLFVLACHLLVERGVWQRIWARTPPVAAGFGYAVALTAALLLAPEQGQTFIYFTF